MNEDTELSIDQREAAERLAEALNGGRFVLFRQRIEPLAADNPEHGFQEILIRFLDEDERRLHPGQFFATLERCGLLFTLDCWVVSAVISWLADRQRSGDSGELPVCSINLSPESIANPELPRYVSERLTAAGLPHGKILFEIMEDECSARAIALVEVIAHLACLGCRFALAGYTGRHVTPALLRALGISFVKVDSSIIQNVHCDRASYAMAQDIVRSCRACGIRTIASFVELPETVDTLGDIGVDHVQGFGIAVPEPLP